MSAASNRQLSSYGGFSSTTERARGEHQLLQLDARSEGKNESMRRATRPEHVTVASQRPL